MLSVCRRRRDWDSAPEWADRVMGLEDFNYWCSASNYAEFDWHKASGEVRRFEAGCVTIGNFELIEMRPVEDKVRWVGKGLPPIGCECEALDTLMAHPKYCLVKIKGFYNKQVWLTSEAGVDLVLFTGDLKFRPLKTQKEKDRDAFIELATNTYYEGTMCTDMAAALFDAGFTAPKAEK